MSDLSELLDSRTCHQCGKQITVLYPHLWRYRRRNPRSSVEWYFCSWGCMRAYDSERKEEEMDKKTELTKGQREKAIDMARNGQSPLPYLKECGSKNPTTAWDTIRRGVRRESQALYDQLPARFGPAKPRKAPETPERIGGICPPPAEVETPEAPRPSPFEYKTTGISTTAGDFQYYRKQGYVDWTPIGDTATVSLKVEEWKELIDHINTIFMVLGVEM